MVNREAPLILLLVLSFVLVSLPEIEAIEWVEVARFTGSETLPGEHLFTDYFTCHHVEWRILWEFAPSSKYLGWAVFGIVVYEKGEDVRLPEYVIEMSKEEESGVTYIHDQEGIFYMEINAQNTANFTVIVEQDVDSIPEFPSWIIIPLFVIATLTVMIFRKRLTR